MMSRRFVAVVLWAAAAAAKPKPPRQVGIEELIETADAWLLDFDDDDDGRLSEKEMEPVLEGLRTHTSAPSAQAAQLSTSMFMGMADSNSDGHLTRAELIDLLKRMKGYDGGYIERKDAVRPATEPENVGYGTTHEERMGSRPRTSSKRTSVRANSKDET